MAIVQTTQAQNNQNVENHNVVDTKMMTDDQVQQVAQQKAVSQSTMDVSLTQNETNNASNQTKQASNYEVNQQSWNNYDQQKQQYVTKSKGDVANQATVQSTEVVGNNVTNKDQNVPMNRQRKQNNDARMVQNDGNQVSNVCQNTSNNYAVKQTRDNGGSVDAPITDTLPKEQDSAHDSVYHLNTTQGWSNDVQTILYGHDYDTNRYFFLHSVDGAMNPFGPSGQDWESITGNDDANSKFMDAHIALNSHGPSGVADTWKSAWTGSIVESKGDIAGVPNGAEVAYFAGLNASDGSQNIYAAWSSDDGETFTHALNGGHPILAWNMDGASGKKDQERDSYVTYDENGKLLMYTAEGNQLGVYTSTDGIHWTSSGKVGSDQFFKGLKWDDGQNMPIECPQLANMKDSSGNSHIVLLYGDKDPQKGQTTGTYYVVGHLDDHDDFIADYPAHRLDAGSDYYGANIGQVTLDTSVGVLDSMGWIGNWNYTSAGVYDNQNSQGKMTSHLGSYSMNRTLSLNDDGTISVELPNDVPHDAGVSDETSCSTTHPVFDCEKYPGQTKTVGQDKFGKIYQMYGSNTDGSASMYNFNFHDKDYGSEAYNGNVYLKISQGKDYIIVKYDPTTGDYQVSRYASELNNDMQKTVASSYYYDGALGKGQGYSGNDGKLAAGGSNLDGSDASQFTINVYTDKDSVVIQFPNGTVYTVARYCTDDEQCVDVYTSYFNGKMKIERECFNGPATNDKPGYDMPQEPSNNTAVVTPSADNNASDALIASGSRIKGTDANPVFDSGKTAQEIDAANGTNGESSSASSNGSSSNKPSNSSSSSTQNKPASDNSGSTSSSDTNNKPSTSQNGSSSSQNGNSPDKGTPVESNGQIVSSSSVTGKVIASSNGYEWVQNGTTIKFIHSLKSGKVDLLGTFNDVSNIKLNQSSANGVGKCPISFNFETPWDANGLTGNALQYVEFAPSSDGLGMMQDAGYTEQSAIKYELGLDGKDPAKNYVGDGTVYDPSSPIMAHIKAVYVQNNGNNSADVTPILNNTLLNYEYDAKDDTVTNGMVSTAPFVVDNVKLSSQDANSVSYTTTHVSNNQTVTLGNNWLNAYEDAQKGTSSSNNGGNSSSDTSSSTSDNTDHLKQPTNNPNDVNHDQTGSSSKPTTGTSSTTDSKPVSGGSTTDSSNHGISSSSNKPGNGDTGTTSTSKPVNSNSSSISTNKPASDDSDSSGNNGSSTTNKPVNDNKPVSGNSGSGTSQTNGNQPQSGSNDNQPNSGDSSSSMTDNYPSKPDNGSSSSQDSGKQPVNGSQSGADSSNNGSSSSSITNNPIVKPTTGTTSSNANGSDSTSTSADQSSSNSKSVTNGSSLDTNSGSNDMQQVGGITSSNDTINGKQSSNESDLQSSNQDVANQDSASHTGNDIASDSSNNVTNDNKVESNVGKSSVVDGNQNDTLIGSNLNQNGSNDNNVQLSNGSSLQQLGSQRGSGLVDNKIQNVGSSTKNDSSMNQNSNSQDLPQTGEMNEGLLMLGMSALLLGTAMLLEKHNKD